MERILVRSKTFDVIFPMQEIVPELVVNVPDPTKVNQFGQAGVRRANCLYVGTKQTSRGHKYHEYREIS